MKYPLISDKEQRSLNQKFSRAVAVCAKRLGIPMHHKRVRGVTVRKKTKLGKCVRNEFHKRISKRVKELL